MEPIDISQVGSECDDIIFTTSSSTCGSSSVSGPHNPKLKTRAKSLKNFKSVSSFRRRVKSRNIHLYSHATSDEDSLLDSSESSPRCLKLTSCSPSKKMVSLGRNDKPSRALVRTPSFRNSRILIKKVASFEPKRGSLSYSKASGDVDIVITRGTYSPTVKISIKFPEPVELQDTVRQMKRFMYNRRRLLRWKRSLVPKTEPEKRNSDRRKDFRFQVRKTISIEEQVDRDESRVEKTMLFGMHGEHCPSCSCNKNDNQIPQCGLADEAIKTHGQVVYYNEDTMTSSRVNEKPNHEDCPETDLVRYVESTKKNIEFSSSSNSKTPSDFNSEGEGDSTTESAEKQNSKRLQTTCNVVQVNDSETNAPIQEAGQLHINKLKHTSVWNLIHQRMASNSTALEGEGPVDGENSFLARESLIPDSNTANDSENQESELRKVLATKLVREAIEKILLPEVQDQTSDDQSSVSSESTPRAEIFERNHPEAFTEENCAETNAADKDKGNESSQPKQTSPIIDDTYDPEIKKIRQAVVNKSGNKAPKHWSNLKKWVLLQRFIRELEKVKKLKPKKAHLLPQNPDPEANKDHLRPLKADEKKNSEEWMLDYALRQAIGQLAPTQKRKVALLVRAFESVAPTKEDKDEHEPLQDQESGLKETEKPLHLGGDYGESVKKFQENLISNPVEGKTEELGQQNHIKMWHMIYQHVVAGIAQKVGSQLLAGAEDEEVEDDNHVSSGFTKPDALKLVKEAVSEISLPETQDEIVEKSEVPKAKNWSKLKNIILIKRSIRELETARKVVRATDLEPEKIGLRRQIMDEKKKAEQWMLDYAVQHIVATLTPARKRKVCMLVEAFEAVVPLPDMRTN